MRRKEYVGAAVCYYRSILDGIPSQAGLSDLKRTYNRGNYTKGLAFGQDKRFLSRSVQGHIGEKVGVVKVEKGRFLVESSFRAKQGDAFKILRDGKEVGGAAFGGTYSRGFVLFSKVRLLNGDTVFVTTDIEVNQRVVSGEVKKKRLQLNLRFAVGERACAQADGITVYSDAVLEEAASRALTVEELKDNFSKVDGLPLEVVFLSVDVVGNVFMPKSLLNAFRRSFYAALSTEIVSGGREQLSPCWSIPSLQGTNAKLAVAVNTVHHKTDGISMRTKHHRFGVILTVKPKVGRVLVIIRQRETKLRGIAFKHRIKFFTISRRTWNPYKLPKTIQ